jgi:non-heme chloroperoxidase
VALAETDFRSEIQQIRMPTLIIHGDQHGDQDTACPIDATGRKVAKAVPKSEFKVYPGAKQRIISTHASQVSSDLIEFIKR